VVDVLSLRVLLAALIGWLDRQQQQRSPRATPPDVISKILYLRQQYHFGPRRPGSVTERGVTADGVPLLPFVERFPRNPEMPACLGHTPARRGLLQGLPSPRD
jgi:hypothetical protein